MKNAAGIHFSTFQDPKDKDKTPDQASAQDDAVAAGAQTVRSNHKPSAEWKARHFAPARPDREQAIRILEP